MFQWLKKNQYRLFIILLMAIASLYFVHHNHSFYKTPIVKVTDVERIDEEKVRDEHRNEDQRLTDRVTGVVMNGTYKGEVVIFENEHSISQAFDYEMREGLQLLVTLEEKEGGLQSTFMTIKRDQYIVWMAWAFVAVLLLVGGKRGALALISFTVNALLLYVGLELFIRFDQVSLLAIASLLAVLFTVISLLFVSGFQRKTYAAIVTTLIGTTITMLVVTFVMWWTGERGLYYEEMQFLTRPYFVIFMASLLIGLLGAVMDVAITMASSIFELYETDPHITIEQLKEAGEEIGRDVMGTITSILFFAYMSGAIPMLLLYVMNNVPLSYALPINLSLELARALAGGIGIVLSIPISLYVSITFAKKSEVVR